VNDEVPDYLGLPLGRFLELVASEDPAPAAGSVAAVAVALAASLCAMAARLSTNQLPGARELARRADHLRDETASLARADAYAYAGVIATGRAREGEFHDALSRAADVPLAVASLGAEVAEISARLARAGNPNLEGDAISAALLAEAGVSAAARLAKINLTRAGIGDKRLAHADTLVESAASSRRAAQEGRIDAPRNL
jgi:formiminotetrahydrofolate cyclodeaminase